MIAQCFRDKREYYCFKQIEEVRTKAKKNTQQITLQDFGAGSRVNSGNTTTIAQIAKSATSGKDKAQLFFKLAKHFGAKTIVELGTNLGISTAYLASVNSENTVYTFEGDPSLVGISKENFKSLGLNNIEVLEGNFDKTLPMFLGQFDRTINLVYLDGNHRKAPTLQYYEWLLPYFSDEVLIIVDDIRWSDEMYDCWLTLLANGKHSYSLDYGTFGLIVHKPATPMLKAPADIIYIDSKLKPWQIGLFS